MRIKKNVALVALFVVWGIVVGFPAFVAGAAADISHSANRTPGHVGTGR